MATWGGSLTFLRTFSLTSPACNSRSRLAKLSQDIPPYPYGAAQWYKQSNYGLYGGTKIQFGNTVSEKTEIKNRRKWKPNIHYKRLWSQSLNRWIRINVATRALRTIDKCGGLDEYLLGYKPSRIKELGFGGWLLRWRIMQTPSIKKRFAAERRALGLPDPAEMNVSVSGKLVHKAQLQAEIKEYDESLNDSEEGDEVEIQLSEETNPEKPKIVVREKEMVEGSAEGGTRITL